MKEFELALWRASEYAALFAVALLLFGSFQTWGYPVYGYELALFRLTSAIIGIWALLYWCRFGFPPYMRFIAWSIVTLLVFLGWSFIQVLPIPTGILTTLSSAHRDIITSFQGAGLSIPSTMTIALSEQSAWDAIHHNISMICLFMGCACICQSVRKRYWLIVVASLFGLVGGWIGLFRYFAEGVDRANGAFFNPNHHAASVLMTLPSAWILVLKILAPYMFLKSQVNALLFSDKALFGGLFVVLASFGWLLGLSRSSFAIGVIMFSVWIIWEWRAGTFGRESRDPRKRFGISSKTVGATVLVLGIIGLIVANEMGPEFGTRGQDVNQHLHGRVAMVQATLRGFWDSPIVGLGMGGTEFTLNRYLDSGVTRKIAIWSHNEYAQLLADLGLVGLVLLIFPAAKAGKGLYKELKHVLGSKRYYKTQLERAVILGLGTVLLHSAFDFPLRVPGLALQFMCLCAWLGTSDYCLMRKRDIGDPDPDDEEDAERTESKKV